LNIENINKVVREIKKNGYFIWVFNTSFFYFL
jgi:hypothetical protein